MNKTTPAIQSLFFYFNHGLQVLRALNTVCKGDVQHRLRENSKKWKVCPGLLQSFLISPCVLLKRAKSSGWCGKRVQNRCRLKDWVEDQETSGDNDSQQVGAHCSKAFLEWNVFRFGHCFHVMLSFDDILVRHYGQSGIFRRLLCRSHSEFPHNNILGAVIPGLISIKLYFLKWRTKCQHAMICFCRKGHGDSYPHSSQLWL